ncbi:hypothetical protein 1 [Beihai sobemo-like virus 25]|uniref:hypothetical protein 1 n=1 Tax=Beihai sobemo-like virus 25 TaxID=1922697 RepID=UPI00090BC726|nr:hypothetical protein 1 [Beihai sobemo-like virus 25]APG75686.1 hypothetical protein 1 [Beihai sobemo-like virus 25]
MDSMGPRWRSKQQYVDFDDDRYHRHSYENASIAGSVTRRRRSSKKERQRPATKDRPSEVHYKIVGKGKPVHGPSAPKMQPEALQVIEDHKEEIVALGFEEGVFAYPDMSPDTERKSLEAHLNLFGERTRTITHPPTDDEHQRCSRLVAEMMQSATFVPKSDYREVSGVLDIINSSIIDPKKASGYPYCLEGKPTNGQVLEQYGVRGFAQHVLNTWEDLPFQVKNFLKGEPTKKTKLDKGMPRCIEGFPLHVTVKHASVFSQLAMTLVKQWKHIPVKYAFSPANPGHIEHLKECLPGKVWESDKTNWDYLMYLWIANVVRDSIKKLVIKPAEWTEEQYSIYLSDIDGCFKQVFEEASYRTSDGHIYQSNEPGIMKSGWFMTIGANSIAQVAVHVMTCIRLGMSDDDILSTPIVAGGDDVNQAPVPAGKAAYLEEAQKLGVSMEIHERGDLYESEYFSSDLRLGVEGPEFFPKRWTKHIEHLKTVKRENLADALVSHMENYRHHVDKFNLLVKLYLSLEEKYPADFPKSKLVSRSLLRARQYGYEHALLC